MEDGKCILIEDLCMHKKSEVTDFGKSILWTDAKVEDVDVEINLRTPDYGKSMLWPDAREEDVDVDINLHTPGFPVIPTQTQFNEGTAATRSVPASSSATVTQSLVGTQKPTSVTTQSQSTTNTTSSSQSQTPTATTNTISASNSTGGSSRTGASGSNSTGGSCSNSTRASGSNSTGASCSNSISASYSNSTRDSGSSSTIASGSNSTRSSGSNSTGASGSSSTTVKTYLDETPRKMATSRFFYKGFTGFKWILRLYLFLLLFGNVNPKSNNIFVKIDWQSYSMVHVLGGTWNLTCSKNDFIANEICIWSRRNFKSGERELINLGDKPTNSTKFEIDGSTLMIKNVNEEDISDYCYYSRIGTTPSHCKYILDQKNHVVIPSKTAVTFPMNKTIRLQSGCYPNLTFFMIIQNRVVANQTATKKDNNRLYEIDMTFNGTLKGGEQFLVIARHGNKNITVYNSTDLQIIKHKEETGLSGWEIFGVVVGVVVVVILIAVCIVCACKKKQAKNDENDGRGSFSLVRKLTQTLRKKFP